MLASESLGLKIVIITINVLLGSLIDSLISLLPTMCLKTLARSVVIAYMSRSGKELRTPCSLRVVQSCAISISLCRRNSSSNNNNNNLLHHNSTTTAFRRRVHRFSIIKGSELVSCFYFFTLYARIKLF